MNIEEIIINLKILEKIEINQKLITHYTYFNIEPQSLVPECFRRWNRQDNRNEAIKKINSIVNCGFFFLQKDTELSEKYELKKYLSSSIFERYIFNVYSKCFKNRAYYRKNKELIYI